jgi:hypothetical protein
MEKSKCKIGGGQNYEPFNFGAPWLGFSTTISSSYRREGFGAYMQYC